MRRVRVHGVGSDDKPLLQHRREAVPVEVNPALEPDRRAKRRRLHRSVKKMSEDSYLAHLRHSQSGVRCEDWGYSLEMDL